MLQSPSKDIDPESKISQLAIILTAWRSAIERIIFNNKSIIINSSELATFGTVFELPHRYRRLNELTYVIELPKALNNTPSDVVERL